MRHSLQRGGELRKRLSALSEVTRKRAPLAFDEREFRFSGCDSGFRLLHPSSKRSCPYLRFGRRLSRTPRLGLETFRPLTCTPLLESRDLKSRLRGRYAKRSRALFCAQRRKALESNNNRPKGSDGNGGGAVHDVRLS